MTLVLIVLSTYMNMANEYEQNVDYNNLMQLKAGINLGNALDSYVISEYEDITDFETSLHNCRISPSLFEFIKGSGFSTVRIPVTWMNHLDENDVIDPIWLEHVGNVVTWALDSGLYVVIDVHHDTWMVPSYENKDEALRLTGIVWGQIADYFKGYDRKLVFEGFNEPRLIGTEMEWKNGTAESYEIINLMNQCFVDKVRETGSNNTDRYLLISGYRTGSDKEILDNIEIPEDDHIALAVHAYIPYEFVSKKNGTTEWGNNEKDTESIDVLFNNLESFSKKNDIPVIITEFGALDKDNQESRVKWCRYFTDKARKAEIPMIWWDNNYPARPSCGYSLIDRLNEVVIDQEIVDILIEE